MSICLHKCYIFIKRSGGSQYNVVISRISMYCAYGGLKDDFYFLMYRVLYCLKVL